jgi:hypothetical protein
MDGQSDGRMDRCMIVSRDGWMDQWMDGWMDGWIRGWMGGCFWELAEHQRRMLGWEAVLSSSLLNPASWELS